MTLACYPFNEQFIEEGTFTVDRIRRYPEENICYCNRTIPVAFDQPLSFTLFSTFALWTIQLKVTSNQAVHVTSFRGKLGASEYLFTAVLTGGDEKGAMERGTWSVETPGTAQEVKYPLDITVPAKETTATKVIELLVPALRGLPEGGANMWLTIDGRELKIPLSHSVPALYKVNHATEINLTLDNQQLITDVMNTTDWPDVPTNSIPVTW